MKLDSSTKLYFIPGTLYYAIDSVDQVYHILAVDSPHLITFDIDTGLRLEIQNPTTKTWVGNFKAAYIDLFGHGPRDYNNALNIQKEQLIEYRPIKNMEQLKSLSMLAANDFNVKAYVNQTLNKTHINKELDVCLI